MIIGTSPENPGVSPDMVEGLQDLMYAGFFRGVTLDYSEFTNTLAVVTESDELVRRVRAAEERSIKRNQSKKW